MATNSGAPVVSGTTPLPTGSSSSPSAGSANALASQQIAGNFQSFLTLLTTQLQNQNPLDPLDTNQFTQQLVEFAGVQQQLNTNDSLATLVSLQQTAQSTTALGFVGKNAVVSGSTAVLPASTATTAGSAIWDLSVAADSTVNITIANSTGATIFSGAYTVSKGDNQPFVWNGQSTDGTQQPAGNYTLTATAAGPGGSTVGVTTGVQGIISSVDLTQTPPLLTINGQNYTVSQIQAIVD